MSNEPAVGAQWRIDEMRRTALTFAISLAQQRSDNGGVSTQGMVVEEAKAFLAFLNTDKTII